jgi:hypothetical protein
MALRKKRLLATIGEKCAQKFRILFYMLFLYSDLSKFFRITQSEWLEKGTTGNLGQDEFYSLTLEIPACSIGGYYLLYVRDSVNVHLLSSWV